MAADVTPLVVGTALALAGLALVLSPLVNDGGETTAEQTARAATRSGSRRRTEEPEEASDGAVAALREIEFDRETGKLSDFDYADLKSRYTKAALEELRAADRAKLIATSAPAAAKIALSPSADVSGDPVEAAIRRAKANQRSCTVCGPRTEPDAVYCSSCGRYLPGSCGRCGEAVELVGSRYCSGCGEQLAA